MAAAILEVFALTMRCLVTAVVMWITLRVPVVAVVGGVVVVALVSLTGADMIHWLPPVGGGLLLGLLAGARLKPGWVILGTGLTIGAIYAAVYPAEAIEAHRQMMVEMIQQMTAGAQITSREMPIEPLADLLIGLLPSALIIEVTMVLAISYALASRALPRMGLPVRPPAPLETWRLPFGVIWTLAAGLAAAAAGWWLESDLARIIGLNVSVLHGTAFFVLGLALVRFALETRRIAQRAQLAIAALLFLLTMIVLPVALVISALGLFDMWFDFRKLDQGVAA